MPLHCSCDKQNLLDLEKVIDLANFLLLLVGLR